MNFFSNLGTFFQTIGGMLSDPYTILLLLGSSFLGIVFGALPGLTATLGVALLTTLTYSMDLQTALIALISMYVGAVYGGSYPSILINIPGTAAAAATALDGYPMAQRGEGGKALGLTTTASFIGTVIGMLALIAFAPLIADAALQFTSYEFFLLAFFGIIISGTLTSDDLVYKGWIAGLLGLALSCIGRDQLQSFPRYTFGISDLEGGIEVVPVLIGAFAIPQIIKSMRDRRTFGKAPPIARILASF
jgi:putative tricarboxylic transport membrane protein